MAARTLNARTGANVTHAPPTTSASDSDVIDLDTSSNRSSNADDAAIDAGNRFWWSVSGLSGCLAVGLGAFGAHGLKARVTDTYYLDIWQTAAHYHLVHALAIAVTPIAVGAMRRHRAKTGQTVWQSVISNFTQRITPNNNTTNTTVATPKRAYRNWSGRAFLFGTVFFSGSLYALTLTENKKWGAVTPIGGVGFILGWSTTTQT